MPIFLVHFQQIINKNISIVIQYKKKIRLIFSNVSERLLKIKQGVWWSARLHSLSITAS